MPRGRLNSARGLPSPARSLVGRRDEVALLDELLQRSSHRLLTLTGPGGVGKTRLAIEVAIRAAARPGADVSFIDLAPLRDANLVISAIARVLGVTEAWREGLPERVVGRLKPRDALLVIDNFEHVLGAAPGIGELLAACPRLRVLTTSREPLRLAWEQELHLEPLKPPPAEEADPDVVAANAAVALFVERARAVRPDLALGPAEVSTMARICRRLDGLPLAIELAASRARSLPLSAVLEHVERGLDLLTQRSPDVPDRHLALRTTIGWSYELLTPREQRLFRRLAVFSGGCTPEAALAVCEDGLADDAAAATPSAFFLDRLTSLVEKNLLAPTSGGNEARFGMLETVREYARERLHESRELSPVRERHAAYFCRLAERASPDLEGGTAQAGWLERVELELDNVREALRWALEDGGTEVGLRTAAALAWFWFVRGHGSEGRAWLDLLLEGPPARGPAALRIRLGALRALALLAYVQGDYHRATAHKALRVARRLGERRDIALILNLLGLIDRWEGRYSRATGRHQEALTLLRDIDDPVNVARTLTYLGSVALDRGDRDQAISTIEEAVARFRALRYPGGTAYALALLAYVLVRRDVPRAEQLAIEAHEIAGGISYGWSDGLALLSLARVAECTGQIERAAALLREAISVLQERGEPALIPPALESLARVAASRRRWARAAALLGAAARLRDEMGAVVAPVDRAERARVAGAAQRFLGEHGFGTSSRAGAAQSLAELLAAPAAPAGPGRPRKAPTPAPGGRSLSEVSPREREVTTLIADGHTNREIGAALGITEGTVEAHVQHILNKLGFRSRSQIAAWAASRDQPS